MTPEKQNERPPRFACKRVLGRPAKEIRMKIHLIIEIEDDGKTRRATVQRMAKVAELNGDGELLIAPAAALEIIKRKPGRPPKHQPLPIPPLAEPEPPKVKTENHGGDFDPAFVKIIEGLPEPFTRRSIAVSTGLDVGNVTLRLNRLKHRGWVEQPAREMWRKTRTFGEKP
jgi:hypothetical protein